MATQLKKVVTRELTKPIRGKSMMVSLLPGDMISMRVKGSRLSYEGNLEQVYHMLAKIHARAERNKQNENKALKRMGLA